MVIIIILDRRQMIQPPAQPLLVIQIFAKRVLERGSRAPGKFKMSLVGSWDPDNHSFHCDGILMCQAHAPFLSPRTSTFGASTHSDTARPEKNLAK